MTGATLLDLHVCHSSARAPSGTEKNQAMTVNESDLAIRLLLVQTLTEETFGDKEKVHRWLRRPLAELGGEAPLITAQTEGGAEIIEAILGKIAWGAAA